MKNSLKRKLTIIKRFLESLFIKDTAFLATSVIDEMKAEMKAEKEINAKKVHDLRLKDILSDNDITSEEDNDND